MDLLNKMPRIMTYEKEIDLGIKFGFYKAKLVKEGGEITATV